MQSRILSNSKPKFKAPRKFCNIKQLKILYYSFVESLLTNDIIAWGGLLKNYMSKMDARNYLKEKNSRARLFGESEIFDIRQSCCSHSTATRILIK